ncbi:MAG: hypothetical protein WC742_02595 [Gallionellaceae bacterium]|jgi:hypothetical protein
MATFFGIDERNAQGFIDRGVMCIPHTPDGKQNLQAMVSPIKREDIVFIKHCTPQFTLHIKAIGIVQSDYPTGSDAACLPVKWLWQGEKVPENTDEALLSCGESIYEEHNISVQKEIIDLLPEMYQIPPVGSENIARTLKH